MINDPIISIDRASKRIAYFDSFEIVREFEDYSDEAVALDAAKEWFKERTNQAPKVVYPKINKIKLF